MSPSPIWVEALPDRKVAGRDKAFTDPDSGLTNSPVATVSVDANTDTAGGSSLAGPAGLGDLHWEDFSVL